MKISLIKIIISVVLLVSLVGNTAFFLKLKEQPKFIEFKNANSRDTYFSVHNVKQAQSISQGKRIKIGILDHYFGYQNHKDLFKNAVDFLNDTDSMNYISEHGYWLALTLKEIAPECEVYALNTLDSSNEDNKVTAMIKAIHWAIENNIDILTYSEQPISEKNRQRLDEAVNEAVSKGIITTFLHYDHPDNIRSTGMYAAGKYSDIDSREFKREPDIDIFQYDYTMVLMDQYEKYRKVKVYDRAGSHTPYYSNSSTSVVTAGFVAILKSINSKLTPEIYRDILKKTSYKTTYKDPFTLQEIECPHVADIAKAVDYLKENYK